MARSIRDILSSGNSAEKFRDHLGKTYTISGYQQVETKNGSSIQFTVNEIDRPIWAPSVVAKQIQELAECDYLPAKLLLTAEESANGREYFTLVDPN